MKIEYIVNRDKKTVVARFKYDARKEIFRDLDKTVDYCRTFGLEQFIFSYKNPVGVARYKDGDVFNENVGKEVAKDKLLRAYYRIVSKAASYLDKKYQEFIISEINKKKRHADEMINKMNQALTSHSK
jgi:hypothetical protein